MPYAKCFRQDRGIQYLKAHIDGGGVLIFVFDLSLSKCGPTIYAPVNRLAPLIQVPVLIDLPQRTHDICLSLVIHSEVRLVPLTQHTEPNKISLLTVNLNTCILTT
ncbi:MAG: hypothetical protein JW384_01420 [Nitrosomonadaceae bacterium]|nr:hypothetical protein [Nitrosomonadaceae bacterium]